MFYKIGVFKNFAKLAGLHLCRSLLFNKLYKNRDSDTGFFLTFYEIFMNTFFYRTPLVDASEDRKSVSEFYVLSVVFIQLSINRQKEFAKLRAMQAMRASVVYVPICPRAKMPKNVPTSHFHVPTCHRAIKHANVLESCQFFNFSYQKTQQFFNYFPNEFFNF